MKRAWELLRRLRGRPTFEEIRVTWIDPRDPDDPNKAHTLREHAQRVMDRDLLGQRAREGRLDS